MKEQEDQEEDETEGGSREGAGGGNKEVREEVYNLEQFAFVGS